MKKPETYTQILADDIKVTTTDKVGARNTKENDMTKSSTGNNKETRFPFC